MSGGAHAGTTEEVAGGGTLVAVPARMLDECASLGDVLSRRAWAEDLDDADRDALRAFLPPDVAASDEALGALLDRLLRPRARRDEGCRPGNPASRAWRVMRDREFATRTPMRRSRRRRRGGQGRHRVRTTPPLPAVARAARPNEALLRRHGRERDAERTSRDRWREARETTPAPRSPLRPEARVAPACSPPSRRTMMP